METSSSRFAQGVLGIALVAALPLAELAASDRLYAQALIVFGAFLVGAVVARSEWADRRVVAARGQIEMVDTVAAPPRPLTVRVLRARGACPLGFQPGQAWSIDARGHLSPVLCRGALQPLSSLLQQDGHGEGVVSQVACRCPLAGRQLILEVRPAAQVA